MELSKCFEVVFEVLDDIGSAHEVERGVTEREPTERGDRHGPVPATAGMSEGFDGHVDTRDLSKACIAIEVAAATATGVQHTAKTPIRSAPEHGVDDLASSVEPPMMVFEFSHLLVDARVHDWLPAQVWLIVARGHSIGASMEGVDLRSSSMTGNLRRLGPAR